MSDKIDTAMAAIATKLGELVTSGTLKQVLRRRINPAAFHGPLPVAALVVDDLHREGKVWMADLSLALLCFSSAGGSDAELVEIIAAVDAKLTTLQDASGSLGGNLDRPEFTFWYVGPQEFVLVGAVASMRLRVGDPLTT